jgi:hypothetical protein
VTEGIEVKTEEEKRDAIELKARVFDILLQQEILSNQIKELEKVKIKIINEINGLNGK